MQVLHGDMLESTHWHHGSMSSMTSLCINRVGCERTSWPEELKPSVMNLVNVKRPRMQVILLD